MTNKKKENDYTQTHRGQSYFCCANILFYSSKLPDFLLSFIKLYKVVFYIYIRIRYKYKMFIVYTVHCTLHCRVLVNIQIKNSFKNRREKRDR